MRLQNKVVLLTEVNFEKGYELAKLILENGARLAVTVRDKEEGIKFITKLKRELGFGTDVVFLKCDMIDTESIKNMAYEVIDHFGRVDVLINSLVGYMKNEKIILTRENEDKLSETIKYISELMVEQNYGNIINLVNISDNDIKMNFDLREYIENLSKSLLVNNIRINTVMSSIEKNNKESIIMLASDESKAMNNEFIG